MQFIQQELELDEELWKNFGGDNLFNTTARIELLIIKQVSIDVSDNRLVRKYLSFVRNISLASIIFTNLFSLNGVNNINV